MYLFDANGILKFLKIQMKVENKYHYLSKALKFFDLQDRQTKYSLKIQEMVW